MVRVTMITPWEESVVAERGDPKKDISEAVVRYALNEVASAKLKIPCTNKEALALVSGVLPTVAIYDGTHRAFIGSVANCKRDIFGNMEFELDGAMSWLGNIAKPPFTVPASLDMSAETYLGRLFEQYNIGSEAIRTVFLGACTVDRIVDIDHHDEYTSMLDLLKELVEKYGGYIFENPGAEGSSPTVSYIYEPVGDSGQILEFGVNELSLEDFLDFSDYASRVYAVGKDGLTVTGGYKVDTQAEEKYGRRDFCLKSNAETQAELDAEAQAVLNSRSVPFRSLEFTAQEISKINPNYNRFVIGTTARALDRNMGEDVQLIVNSVERDLINKGDVKVVFGKAPLTISDIMRIGQDIIRNAAREIFGNLGG